MAVFLFVLWIAGTGVGTFDAPFHTACSEFANGYFSAWICFVLSFYYMYTSVPEVSTHALHPSILVLAVFERCF